VEVIDDKALALPPLDLTLARALISRTRVSRIMQQYRGTPSVAHGEVELTLIRLARLAADIPEIKGLDLNPLIAGQNGVLALHARIAVAKVSLTPAELRRGRLAVRPYPVEWERPLKVREDWTVNVRPIRPEDEPAFAAFLQKITREDLRLRFFAPIKEFSH